MEKATSTSLAELERELKNRSTFIRVPPGFDRGFDFPDQEDPGGGGGSDLVNLTSLLAQSSLNDPLGIWTSATTQVDPKSGKEEKERKQEQCEPASAEEMEVLDKVEGDIVLNISQVDSKRNRGPVQTEWAEMLDTTKPMTDFHKQVS